MSFPLSCAYLNIHIFLTTNRLFLLLVLINLDHFFTWHIMISLIFSNVYITLPCIQALCSTISLLILSPSLISSENGNTWFHASCLLNICSYFLPPIFNLQIIGCFPHFLSKSLTQLLALPFKKILAIIFLFLTTLQIASRQFDLFFKLFYPPISLKIQITFMIQYWFPPLPSIIKLFILKRHPFLV